MENTLLWIADFFTDRQMRVSVNGAYSDWAKLTMFSVGTTFVPVIHNDIPASVNCKIMLFEDDTKIWNTI